MFMYYNIDIGTGERSPGMTERYEEMGMTDAQFKALMRRILRQVERAERADEAWEKDEVLAEMRKDIEADLES